MTSDHHLRMAEPSTNSVSMSVTTALIYGVSGTFFFLLVFLLVMMGLTNCDWHCRQDRGSFVVSLIDFPLQMFQNVSEETQESRITIQT